MRGRTFLWRRRRLAATVWLCATLSSGAAAFGDSERTATATKGVGQFSRNRLLPRFDRDRDGELNAGERARIREAFGGIDVPMLPDTPYDYTTVAYPSYIDRAEIARIDNTPADNRTTDFGARLGRVLFYDRQLSRNRTIGCASCHVARAGFSDPRRFSVGYAGGRTGRNAMGLVNLRSTNLGGDRPGFFWDERAPTLEAQVLMPIQDAVEMGMVLSALESRLQALPYYPPLFEAAFGSSAVTSARIAKAVAQFLRSMHSYRSRFDRAASSQDRRGGFSAPFDDFTAQENLGKSRFIDGVGGVPELGCAVCHVPPTFGMGKSMNNGLARKYADRGLGVLDRPSNDPFTPSNDGKFKAPSLRNVELTAPYMHDGRFETLEQVVEHYSRGIHDHENLAVALADPIPENATSGFGYGPREKAALVAFLKTLTDRSFVSDPRFADPFVRADP